LHYPKFNLFAAGSLKASRRVAHHALQRRLSPFKFSGLPHLRPHDLKRRPDGHWAVEVRHSRIIRLFSVALSVEHEGRRNIVVADAIMNIVPFSQPDHTSTQAIITIASNIAFSLTDMLILAGTPAAIACWMPSATFSE
jgi:hypothetical protein